MCTPENSVPCPVIFLETKALAGKDGHTVFVEELKEERQGTGSGHSILLLYPFSLSQG